MLSAETTTAALPLPPAPPASLTLARELRDDLARLLVGERAAAADFLVALADFDRRRGWATLGHASLFAFLHRELGLSNGASFVRFTAARLLQRFPDLVDPLRDGRLCLSSVGELSRVLTPENRSEVLPKFYGCSAREAREVAAALCPREAPPRREVVTQLARQAPGSTVQAADRFSSEPGEAGEPGEAVKDLAQAAEAVKDAAEAAPQALRAPEVPAPQPIPAALRAHELVLTHPARAVLRDEVEPLTADLRRLHVTVSRRFLEKVAAARAGLSHALPGATSEQVLEAALDLLLERQARRKGLVKRPRCLEPRASVPPTSQPHSPSHSPSPSQPTPQPSAAEAPLKQDSQPPLGSSSRSVPAAIRREVWLRDERRCQHPLDAGGICGSTLRLELDHLIPVALGGPSTVANLQVACSIHNREAGRRLLGEVLMGSRHRGRSRHPR